MSSNDTTVSLTILTNGQAISSSYGVKSVQVSMALNKIPLCRIALIDGDVSTSEFAASDSQDFVPGTEIEVALGFGGKNSTVFKGIITRHALKIREAQSHLILDVRHIAIKSTLRKRNRYFYDMKDEDVFQELFSPYSIDLEADAGTASHVQLVQYESSDWDFALQRAQAHGKVINVGIDKIKIENPSMDTGEVATIHYGENVLSFDGEIDARTQVKKVKVRSWDPDEQEEIELDGEDKNWPSPGNISASTLAESLTEDPLVLSHGGSMDPEELKSWATGEWSYRQLGKVRARAKITGDANILPGTLVILKGLGARFSGKAYVTGVNHQVYEGTWETDVQIGLEPNQVQNGISSPSHLTNSELFSGIKGLQVGTVTSLEDPDASERIQVKLPMINNEEEGIWCRYISLDAGEDRGYVFRPEPKDEVLVGFIDNDPSQGVILGMLYSKKHPSPIEASNDNMEKGFVSKSGIKIIFDDEISQLTIETPGGNKIILDDDDGSILMEDQNGNKGYYSSEGISLESEGAITIKTKGDISMEGMNISLKAEGEFTAEGGGGAEISSSGIAVLKGSLVQIN